jgi:BlaI family transcriptional regulator, penicillinase repressor
VRKKSPTLTEAELRLMDILWESGESTVAEVVDALSRNSPLAYSSVLTTLRILEQKKYVSHKKSGRAFLYYPVVGKGQARQRVIDYVLSRFFNNSPELLVLKVLEREKIQPRELQRLKKKIQESE